MIERLQPKSRTAMRGPAPTVYGSCVPASRASGGSSQLGLGERPLVVDVRLAPRPLEQRVGRSLAQGATHRPLGADVPDERAGVDVLERHDVLRRQPLRELGPDSAGDDALGPDARRLHPGLVDAVVADQRVAERQNLRGVARVRDGFLVARHCRGEAGLAGRDAGSAHGVAREDGPVLEHEICGSRGHLTCISYVSTA